jgi:nitronate monooxygenase
VKALNAIRIAGQEVLPIIEGGKGISVSNGLSSGAWAAAGGIGTFSGVNADSFDPSGAPIPQIYKGRTRKERHEELLRYAIDGGIEQARIAHETRGNQGRLHINILWEMGGAEQVLTGVLDKCRDLIHGVTCGAGMPYRLAEIAASYRVHYYPIISSGRAFRALWKRAYHKFEEFLGGVVYEDPWLAGGHNGLSNSEDPRSPEDPYPRIVALRNVMNEAGLKDTPIIMAGGVWWLSEWDHWLDNPEVGPVAFQFGTRPLLTKESPISEEWKKRLTQLKPGDVHLHRFSPTGFYSSAVHNGFLAELEARSDRQIPFTDEPVGAHDTSLSIGARKRDVYVTAADKIPAWGAFRRARSPIGRRRNQVPRVARPTRAVSVFRKPCKTSPMKATSRKN